MEGASDFTSETGCTVTVLYGGGNENKHQKEHRYRKRGEKPEVHLCISEKERNTKRIDWH